MSKVETFMKFWKKDKKKIWVAFFNSIAHSGVLNCLPDELYLKISYRVNMGKRLDLKNPKTFNEKLQWLKIHNRKDIYSKWVDKAEAKKIVGSILGEEYIIPTLGVWDSVEEVPFDELPSKFVLKCTHDSGSVIVCKDKAKFDFVVAKKNLNKCLGKNLYFWGREWPYKNLKGRIIAEKYMQDENSVDLRDYKFYCFNGEPKLLYLSEALSDHDSAKISFLTLDWQFAEVRRSDYNEFSVLPEKPRQFEKMIQFSKILSKGTPFLRVDFYEINNQLYFGELTFFPGGGFTRLEPEEWENKMGDWIILSDIE